MAGGDATWHVEQLVPVTRHGKREDVWWTYGFSPIQDSAGVQGILVVCNDVTAQHQAREELIRLNKDRSAESQRLRSLFRQAPGFMAILQGRDHVFEFVNAAYLRVVGERPLLGLPAREAMPEVEGQGFFELLDQVFTTATPYSANDVMMLIRRQPGAPATQVYVDFVYQPITNADGTVWGIFVEGFDATERRLAKVELQASQERLKEGMIAARMVVWDLDLVDDTVSFSENASIVFGGSWPSLSAGWKSIHQDDVKLLQLAHNNALASKGSYEEVVRLIRPDNAEIMWLQVHGKVICDEAGRPSIVRGVSIDVTERKRAEEALRNADRRKDEFLAMLAHELRNPLAPISAAAHLLNVVRHDEARVRKTSEIIGRQVDHMKSLINDLLDVSRVTTGMVVLEKKPLNIKQIVAESMEQVRPLIELRHHNFTFRASSGSAIVLGDEKRLVQVITNLLQNAAKYTPEGGDIELRLEKDGEQMRIDVRDNGIGIDAELLPHVFELFTQAKRSSDRSQGGLGLGLALVNSLVSLHGGRVGASSDGPGRGSMFSVLLPLSAASLDIRPRRDNRDADIFPARSLRLLVVDDNADAAMALAMFLEAAGHHVTIESEPETALELAAREVPDVYLLDIGLPRMDGNELARRLRSMPEAAGATLIAVSGYGQDHDKETSIAAGFDYYFVKPADPSKLLQLLSELDQV
jgi:signal transduction histidine kinase